MKITCLLAAFICQIQFCLLCAQNPSIGNPPSWNWVQTIGGNSGPDNGQSIAGDTQGNFFIAGDFSGTTQFGSTSLTSQGQVNGFVSKCDPAGNPVWAAQLKSNSPDGEVSVSSITTDQDDNVLVLGHYRIGNLKFGAQTYPLSSDLDLFLAKFNNNGTLLWIKTESTFFTIILPNAKVLTDSDGSVYVSTVFAIKKYSSNGTLLWSRDNEGNGYYDLVIYNEKIYLAGRFINEVYLGGQTLSTDNSGIFLVNLDKATGDYFNARVIAVNTETNNLKITSIAFVGEDDFIVDGVYSGNVTLGAFSFDSPGLTREFVARYAGSDYSWAIQSSTAYGGNFYSSQPQSQLLANSTGDAYLFGLSGGPVGFGNSTIDGLEGGFLAKLDGATGSVDWIKNQPYFVRGFCNGQNLLQIGSKFPNAIFRETNDAGSVLLDRTLTGDSGLGYVTSAKIDQTGVYFAANVSGQTYFLGQNNINPNAKGGTVVAKVNHEGNNLLWHQTIEGANSIYTFGHTLWLDKSHDKLYLIGTFSAPFQFGAQLVDTVGNMGLFVAQMGADGTFGWIKTLPTSAYINSVITDAAGNVIINGTFFDQLQLGNTTLVSAGGSDIFWAKLSLDGQYQFAQRMGGESEDIENYASVDAMGNFYMSGEYLSQTIDFNGSNQTERMDGDGVLFHVKFNPGGQVVWVKNLGDTDLFGTESGCAATNVEVDAAGNSFIIGYHGASTYFDNYHLSSPYSFNHFATKLDPSGNVLWAKSIQTRTPSYNFCEIGLDESGDCYIGSQYRDSIFFDGILIKKVGAQDAYFAKLNGSNGSVIWVKTISGSSESIAWPASIAVYDKESLIVGGHINDRLNFDGTSVNTYNGRKGYLALIGEDITVSTEQPGADLFYVKVFPSPAREYLNVTAIPNFQGYWNLEIINASGQVLATKSIGLLTEETTFDLSGYPSGTYFIKAISEKGSEVIRFIKN